MKVEIDWGKFDSQEYRPLVNMDIPDFNPGTLAYDDFWDEQDRRCLDGWKPKPYMPKITGRHYFYLNMCRINLLKKGATRKQLDYPFYRELDRRLYDELDDAIKHKHGLIVGKPRRVGLSYFGASASSYELLFYLRNKIGVAAGQEDKAQDFYEKVKGLLADIRPEYSAGTSVTNKDEFRLSYWDLENKQKKEYGMQSSMYMKTMYANPSGFEGKELSLVIFEEAGLFEDIIAAYRATEPCFKEGGIQYGIPLIYGTGGDLDKGSKGYQAMWKKPEVYKLKKVLVTATDYFPGDGIPDEKTGKVVSFFDFRTGKTNAQAAYKHIMDERKIAEGSEGFVKLVQSYPLKESEIFIKSTGGHLNRKKLNAQKARLDDCPYLRKKGTLEWHTTDETTLKLISRAKNLKEIDKIHLQRKSKVILREDDALGMVHTLMDPIDHHRLPFKPDIAGCDSYDDDVVEGTGSLGATIVYRCFYSPTKPYDMPIAYIKDRGTSDDDDEFYSQSFRLCVYYDCEMLLEHTKVLIKNYFDGVGGYHYLMAKPELEDYGYKSNAVNKVGFKLPNHYAANLILRLLRSEVNKNFNNIWFEEILDDLIDYGEENSDLGSAYGMCMVAKLDMFGDLSDGIEDDQNDVSVIDGMGYWTKDEYGNAYFTTYAEAERFDDPYSFNKKQNIFNPEFDLDGDEKKEYDDLQTQARKKIEKEREDILSKYDGDIMAFTIEQYRKDFNKN